MATLSWDKPNKNRYELGVDRGVVYVDKSVGFAWNGLISVNEQDEGSDMTPYYIDGVQIRTDVNTKVYKASVKCYSYPQNMLNCLGMYELAIGYYITGQRRNVFDFTYRTKISDTGYKIHVVYNASIKPGTLTYTTDSTSVKPVVYDWELLAVPPEKNVTFRPTAHLIIDSTKTPVATLKKVEDIIYGSASSNPRLPDIDQLLALFN